jgi:hypothetical protein
MASIFISYRRDDASGSAGRLEDDLSERFGDARVFRDREIPAGADFAAHLHDRLADAEVVLVVIGRHWLEAADAHGQRRLELPGDWVRREIETALRLGRTVIPVLVDGAAMPWPDQLPEPLEELAGRQAVSLTDLRWRQDVDALCAQLTQRSARLAAALRQPLAQAPGPGGVSRPERRPSPAAGGRERLGMVLGRWAVGRLGKLFSLLASLTVLYLLVRALGSPNANRMLDRLIDTTVAQVSVFF